jgi:hypothetical protein
MAMRARVGVGVSAILSTALACTGCWHADLFPVSSKAAVDAGGGAVGPDSATSPDGGVPLGGAVYVAPDGDDGDPGTLEHPVRTLAKARELARSLLDDVGGDVIVYLRGGTYPQPSTLTFTDADSGKGGFYVKYMAYQNERPLVTGGQPISGPWTLFDSDKNVYAVSGVTLRFRQLYVNGVKAIRARSPNLGASGAPSFNQATGYSTSDHYIQVAASEVGNWSNLTKAEMHYMTGWADNTLRIASVTTAGSTAKVKFQSTEDAILFVRPYPHLAANQSYFFENALELLDQPGEWYLDEAKKVLYYKPRPGEDLATAVVVVPTLETVVRIAGASTAQPAAYLWFQGLTFAHSTFMRPSDFGFLDEESGQYNLTATADSKLTVGHPPAGVTVTNANHIHFERNMFTQMAATGLDLVSGTHDDVIVGNVFTDIGGTGISVGKFAATEGTEIHVPYNPADKGETCANDTIKNNYINNVTTEIQGGCGIACGYPRNIDIEHNEVTATNYTGISVGYGWTASANAMSNNRINYNNVHGVAKILAGAAGIETLSNQSPASELQYNYLHDFGTSAWADGTAHGFYLNDGTTGYTAAHNVMVNVPNWTIAINAVGNTTSDNGTNPDGAQGTMASAGIEPIYADIRALAIPAARF